MHVHDLAVFVVMETCLGGERAKNITDRLPLFWGFMADVECGAGGGYPIGQN